MSKELEQLAWQANVIRTEEDSGDNTAERVGELFEDIIDWLKAHKNDSSSSSGGGGDTVNLNEPLASLNRINQNPSAASQILLWNGSSWGYSTKSSGEGGGISITDMWEALGRSSSNQIHSSHLEGLTWWGNRFSNGSTELTGQIVANNGVKIGNATLTWDSKENSLKILGNVYATGGVSAFGANSSSGGGGTTPDLSLLLARLNTIDTDPTETGYGLVWDGSNWGYGPISSGGSSVQANWAQTNNVAPDYIKNKPNLAAVATSGSYTDLLNLPVLAAVATSGSYNDLSNKPTIPAAPVQSNWNETNTSSLAYILNKPTDLSAFNNGPGYLTSSSALNASNLTTGTVPFSRLPSMYWANVAVSSSSSNNTEPMFRTVNINGIIVEYDSNKRALKFNGNIYATGNVSAFGSASSSGGGASTLEDLLDTNINNPSSGQILKYNGSKWINSDESSTYVHPTNGANTTITNASGKVLSAITVNSLGHVTSVSSKTLASGDIPNLSWSKITTDKPTTLAGYGITDALSSFTTFWGQTASNGVVSGDMTSVGNITMTGNVKMNRGTYISFRTSTSSTSYLSALGLSHSNALLIGVGTASVGNTVLYGTNIKFVSGSSSAVDAAEFTSAGRLHLKQGAQGLRIGDALLTWDSTNKVLNLTNTTASQTASFAASGGVSALGLSSEGNGGRIQNLTVTGTLTLGSTVIANTSPSIVLREKDDACLYLLNDCTRSKDTDKEYYFNQYDNVGLLGKNYTCADTKWWIDPDGCALFQRVYLSDNVYLYTDGSNIKVRIGSTVYTLTKS